jgi:GNAT superfamily N-acetyltransferase
VPAALPTRYARRVKVRSLGFQTDLMIRLLEGSKAEDRGDYLVVSTPQNPTYWWGNFLLLAQPPQPGEARKWLARFAEEFPAASHVALGIDVTEASMIDNRELIATGLRMERSSVLIASELHEPPHPSSAVIRPLAGDDDWRQAAELRAVLNAGEPGGDPAFLYARIAAERALTEDGHGAWFGAFTDGGLQAQLGLITDGSGVARFQNVETHPAARRQGLAGTLVWRAGQQSLDDGTRTLVMVADPNDVAIRVYRSVGFADAQSQVQFDRHSD